MRAVRRFGGKMRMTRHGLSAGVFILCLLAASSLPAQPVDQGYAAANDKAAIAAISQALRDRDFARAEELTNAAVAAHPNDCRFLTLRGMAVEGLGNRRAAL